MRAPRDEITRALRNVDATWTQARATRLERALEQRLYAGRPRRARAVLAIGFVTAAAAAALVAGPRRWPGAGDADGVGALLPAGAVLRLADGTTAAPLDGDSEVRLVEQERTRRTVRVVRGGARFDVRPQGGRTFRVELRDVAVEVMGTAFTVDEAGERVRVAVDHGRVRTFFKGAAIELSAGDVRFFPPLPAAPAEGPAATDSVDALLKEADRTRAAGSPSGAAVRLREVLARFPGDERAPLAAFTLGLVLLEGGGTPREAALAFARARRLDPEGELAEDALAREVEAWGRAGVSKAAASKAREYVHRYPRGRRVAEVKPYTLGR
jgi:transmembrane sensor